MSASVSPRLVGEHMKRLRSARGFSVRAFATQTGFSPSFISQVENGQVSPSLGSLQKLAETLGVSLGEFFSTAASLDEALVVKPEARRRLDSTWTDAHIEALSASGPGRHLEPVLVVFGPGGMSGKHPHSHSREEFAFIVAGQVTVTLAGEEHTMTRGDAVTLPAGAPRLWRNLSKERAEVLLVSSRLPG
jgi:transcriptional regulator with XRE-family HTH domain